MHAIIVWLQANSGVLSALSALFMVMVWLIYLHLFYVEFIQSRRPRTRIHQTGGSSPKSVLLLVNMSEKTINVVSVSARGFTSDGALHCELNDYFHFSQSGRTFKDMENTIRQGPVPPGDYIFLGEVSDILNRLKQNGASNPAPGEENLSDPSHPAPAIHTLELRVILMHGADDRVFGARRRYSVDASESAMEVTPLSFCTDQLTSRRQRREILGWPEADRYGAYRRVPSRRLPGLPRFFRSSPSYLAGQS
jgi:hypothetical protein